MAIETTRTSIPAKTGNLSDLTVMSYDSFNTWDRGSLMCVITCQSHVTLVTICESCEIDFFVYKKSESIILKTRSALESSESLSE